MVDVTVFFKKSESSIDNIEPFWVTVFVCKFSGQELSLKHKGMSNIYVRLVFFVPRAVVCACSPFQIKRLTRQPWADTET